MARSSECTEQYAQKVFDREPHCQRGLFTEVTRNLFGVKQEMLAYRFGRMCCMSPIPRS